MASEDLSHSQTMALWVGSFFDELARNGVRAVVVSPGSRSTPLAMAAFELSCRRPDDLRVYVDVDERGAAFFGLGMAKATGRPVALVCTSGTATANYYPAVIEAETSRVPLIVLTGDRPPRLQGLGAPQTTDQLNLYGNHVRAFRAMPEPMADARGIAFARQAAREAVIAATDAHRIWESDGSQQVASRACEHLAGPVHLNFPFDEPLKPDFPAADAVASQSDSELDAFTVGRRPSAAELLGEPEAPFSGGASRLAELLAGKRALVLAGEGTCSTLAQAREVAAWAHSWSLPLLADPLSGMRAVDQPHVIDAYDAVFGRDDCPLPEVVIRFGRWPVSKRTTTKIASSGAFAVVVDAGETRDFNAMTDCFIPLTPLEFIRQTTPSTDSADSVQQAFLDEWIARNNDARARIDAELGSASSEVSASGLLHEGATIRAIIEESPEGACLFAANSMTVRNLDTFLRRGSAPLCVMANRGQNGIDGTLSTAIGAAQEFGKAVLITGDLTLQHDINALSLQNELLSNHSGSHASLVVVLLNNDGGAIFDMLPQASDDPYFERLFLTPQNVDFEHAAKAFHVPYRRANSVDELRRCYRESLDEPGISLVEVRTPLRGLKERLGGFWK